jgi:predicted CXXCH cytochrome family protein
MEIAMADSNHGFLLPEDEAGHTLLVEVHGNDGQFSRHEIVVPTLAYLPEVRDSGKPPAISQLKVLKVERGVFLTATVGWQTDTITDALVFYGDKDLSQTSEPSKRLGRYHQVVLYNLQPGRNYRFTAVSQDLFGRSQVSEPMTFSTANPLTPELTDIPDNLLQGSAAAGITSSFQRLGTNYLLELRLEQPSAIYIGSSGVSREQHLSDENTGPMEGKTHQGLSSRKVISLDACLKCHRPHSHPVYVIPTPEMTILPEYPTLPDGRITCSSCHAPHGSDYYHFTRKDYESALCVGCHQDLKHESTTD